MQLLLGSGGFRTPERIALLVDLMRSLFRATDKLLFIPYALHDHDRYLEVLRERGLDAGFTLEGIHQQPDPKLALRQAKGIFVGGGNTFRLLHALQSLGLIDVIRAQVRSGVPYLGVSAGTNVACPTIQTTNDMPIVQPAEFNALGLIPFQINPHYFTGQTHVKRDDAYQEHFGETRDDRIREFHEMNDAPVLGLWEGAVLRIDQHQATLLGADARLFRKEQPPRDFRPGSDLSDLL